MFCNSTRLNQESPRREGNLKCYAAQIFFNVISSVGFRKILPIKLLI